MRKVLALPAEEGIKFREAASRDSMHRFIIIVAISTNTFRAGKTVPRSAGRVREAEELSQSEEGGGRNQFDRIFNL